jgi:uncharacterized protein YjbI with pentapeptide repeats
VITFDYTWAYRDANAFKFLFDNTGMAKPELLALLLRGSRLWNDWRTANPNIEPNLIQADLVGADLDGANLDGANLTGADLNGATLVKASLRKATLNLAHLNSARLAGADLAWANLTRTELIRANLSGANLSRANLEGTNLTGATLSEANFTEAELDGVIFSGANLSETIFTNCSVIESVFSCVDLSSALGLESIQHIGPSTIGIDTIYLSKGKIPELFLRGAGIPDTFISYIGSLVGNPIQFYSCFISYSTIDQQFADRLHADLQSRGVRCWFAPHDAQGGKKLHEQIDSAIRLHDKLLLILSPASMKSEWVKTEIAKARKRELREDRRVLFPIRLVDYSSLLEWECFDGDARKDSARGCKKVCVNAVLRQ